MTCSTPGRWGRKTILGRNRYPCAAETCVEESARGELRAGSTPGDRRRMQRPEDGSEALVAVPLEPGVDDAAETRSLPATPLGPGPVRDAPRDPPPLPLPPHP